MSQLIYGTGSTAVTLPYCNISRFTQTARYEESNTDWFCTEFDIQAEAVLNFNYLSIVAPDLVVNGNAATQNPADIMATIRTRLLKPRQTLSVRFNSVELIPQAVVGGTVDAQNGPQPQSCDCIMMTNQTFLIIYRIKASYWENNTVTPSASPIVTNKFGNDVLYNRWSETVDIDGSDYSTRTREGKFVIRSDNAHGFIADQLRSQMAIVSVPFGFLRQSAQYTVDPSGLAIQYRVVDREVFKSPPFPAFRASGDFTERCNRYGAIRTLESHVTLEGSKDSPQERLIEKAVMICWQKIGIRVDRLEQRGVVGNSASFIIDDAYVKIGMYDNVVECYIRCYAPADTKRLSAIAAFGGIPTGTPFSASAFIPPDYHLRGTANILLQAAAYYDPSLANTRLVDASVRANNDNPLLGKAGVQLGNNGAAKQPGQTGLNP